MRRGDEKVQHEVGDKASRHYLVDVKQRVETRGIETDFHRSHDGGVTQQSHHHRLPLLQNGLLRRQHQKTLLVSVALFLLMSSAQLRLAFLRALRAHLPSRRLRRLRRLRSLRRRAKNTVGSRAPRPQVARRARVSPPPTIASNGRQPPPPSRADALLSRAHSSESPSRRDLARVLPTPIPRRCRSAPSRSPRVRVRSPSTARPSPSALAPRRRPSRVPGASSSRVRRRRRRPSSRRASRRSIRASRAEFERLDARASKRRRASRGRRARRRRRGGGGRESARAPRAVVGRARGGARGDATSRSVAFDCRGHSSARLSDCETARVRKCGSA